MCKEMSQLEMSHLFSLTVQNIASPLYVANQNGHSDVVDILVKAGADVNQACTEVCYFDIGQRDIHYLAI